MTVTIMIGDVREQLRKIESDSIHCVVTSPPYWGLRDYGVAGQIGLEATPAEFIATMVDVFEEVRRVLRTDGTCWINMGDSYSGGGNGAANYPKSSSAKQLSNHGSTTAGKNGFVPPGLKPKDLCLMPHRLAIALQDAGWWVRQDIVWAKPNPMPESVTDRCTKAHEYIFLLTKSAKYYYDAEAIKEAVVGDPDAARNRWDTKDYEVPGQKPQKRVARGVGFGHGTDAEQRQRGRVTMKLPGNVNPPKGQAAYEAGDSMHRTKAGLLAYAQRQRENVKDIGRDDQGLRTAARFGGGAGFRDDPNSRPEKRNKRSVWTMSTHSFSGAHFATFPPELPETCIKAGCPLGGIVLDPFFGAGTTGLVADRLQRDCIGIELNPAYAEMARKRIQGDSTLLADVRVFQNQVAA